MTAPVQVPTLTGSHCTLRELRASDAQSLHEFACTDAVIRYMNGGWPEPYTLQDAQHWCAGGWRGMGMVWGIEVQGRIVGCCGVHPDAGWLSCNAEVGYWIGEPYWRRGIGSEALGLISAWAWQQWPGLTRIYAPIFAMNAGSQAVAHKCGYVREALLPQSGIKRGVVIDRVLWATYRTE